MSRYTFKVIDTKRPGYFRYAVFPVLGKLKISLFDRVTGNGSISHHATRPAAIKAAQAERKRFDAIATGVAARQKNPQPKLTKGRKIKARWVRQNANGTITVAI